MPENNINKTGGGGARRLIFTGNVKTTLFNKYTPGSGVGALNRSVRRALVRKAAEPNCKGFCSNVNGNLVWDSMGRYAYYKQFRHQLDETGCVPIANPLTFSYELGTATGSEGWNVVFWGHGVGLGTLTTTANIEIEYLVMGHGGGGGGAATPADATLVSLGGGGGGGNRETGFQTLIPGPVYTIVTQAGNGNGGTTAGTNGTDGGNCTFNGAASVTANGGFGGEGSGSAGAGQGGDGGDAAGGAFTGGAGSGGVSTGGGGGGGGQSGSGTAGSGSTGGNGGTGWTTTTFFAPFSIPSASGGYGGGGGGFTLGGNGSSATNGDGSSGSGEGDDPSAGALGSGGGGAVEKDTAGTGFKGGNGSDGGVYIKYRLCG